jgi:hypothetical protein
MVHAKFGYERHFWHNQINFGEIIYANEYPWICLFSASFHHFWVVQQFQFGLLHGVIQLQLVLPPPLRLELCLRQTAKSRNVDGTDPAAFPQQKYFILFWKMKVP